MKSHEAVVNEEDNENLPADKKVHVVQHQPNHETSLRHLFYLEYKKKFSDGQANPIVYSRFGKAHYNSDEKFDTENFNSLIRTCNLKKLLKAHEQPAPLVAPHQVTGNKAAQNAQKFSEPISFPSRDYYKPTSSKDQTLVFESRFESGNLQLVHKQSDNEYDLVLQNDVNSKGHTQWFYFRVANTRRGNKVKFNMLNMIKSKSLYNDGMKVLVYSQRKQELADEDTDLSEEDRKLRQGWHRGGEDFGYF